MPPFPPPVYVPGSTPLGVASLQSRYTCIAQFLKKILWGVCRSETLRKMHARWYTVWRYVNLQF